MSNASRLIEILEEVKTDKQQQKTHWRSKL